MRVAHIAPSFYPAVKYGGVIESLRQLCCWLARSGAEVRVLTTDAGGRSERLRTMSGKSVEASTGVEVHYCRRIVGQSAAPDLLRRLMRYVQWSDVVHLTAVYSFPTIPTLLACRILKRPLVWSPHGAFQRWPGSRHVVAKAGWERVCRAVMPRRLIMHVTSRAEGGETSDQMPGAEIRVVPNGVEVPAAAAHAPRDGTLRLLYLGRLDPKKGLEQLLDACELVERRASPGWTLTIAGRGEQSYVDGLERRARELGIGRRLSMLGWVDHHLKAALFASADVLVMPSHTENFGMVVTEALAHGVPVIASRGTPWHEVENVGCGLWVSNDPESLSGAIERAARLPLREMGARGREWMLRDFNWPAVARRMLDVYQELAESRS